MDYSLLSAGRITHLKIVVIAVALVAGIAVFAFGISARVTSLATVPFGTEGAVVKVGQLAAYVGQHAVTVR